MGAFLGYLAFLISAATVSLSLFAMVIAYLNGSAFAIPFLLTVPAIVIAGLTLLLKNYFTTKRRTAGFLAISMAALLITGYAPVTYLYEESLARVPEQADPLNYESFAPHTAAAKLDAPASLRLTEPLPKLDSATAAYPMVASFVREVYPENDYTGFTGDGIVLEEHPRYAYHRIVTGERDLIFGPPPTAEQLKKAEQAGVKLKVTLIAKEAFVFYVNKSNPVSDLTEADIQAIYAGKKTEWSDVGGRKKPISAYQRKPDSRSQLEMERIMDGTALAAPPTEPVTESSNGIVRELSEYRNERNALGYSYRNTVQPFADERKVKLLAVGGVSPGDKEIRSGEYPYTAEICAVTAGTEHADAERFIVWMLTDEGQQLVKKSGFTPIREVEEKNSRSTSSR